MAFKNFSEYLFVRVYNEDESAKIATHTIQTGGELGSVRMLVYLKGSNSGSLQLKVFPKGNVNAPICTSNIVQISTVGQDFLGFVRFDFQKNNVPSGAEIDIFAEIAGYTRNSNTDYVALVFDFPNPVYDNLGSSFLDYPIALEDFIYT